MTAHDFELVRLALKRTCRQHTDHRAATCPRCHDAAAAQQDAQWARERRAAHRKWQDATTQAGLAE